MPIGNEYSIDKCILSAEGKGSINLQESGMISSLRFYEDLFHNTISGSISIMNDPFDLVGKYPIVSNETVTVTLTSEKDSSNYEIDFNVFSVANVDFTKPNSKTYSLELVSDEYLSNHKTIVSRSYKDKLISEIVEDILLQDLNTAGGEVWGLKKELIIEPTSGRHNIIITKWNPFRAINLLSQRSISSVRPSTGYVFYESRSGFHFRSYESLVSDSPAAIYTYSALGLTNDNPNKSLAVPQTQVDDSEKITNIEVVKVPNVIENLHKGMYSNRIVSHDWINQNYEVREYNYDEEFFFNSNLNNGKLGSHSGIGNENVIYENYDSQPTEELNGISTRMSRMQQLENFRINISISGNIDRQIGDVIRIEIPSAEQRSTEKMTDEVFGGNYLVTGLKHSISDKHTTVMEMAKDTYGEIEESMTALV